MKYFSREISIGGGISLHGRDALLKLERKRSRDINTPKAWIHSEAFVAPLSVVPYIVCACVQLEGIVTHYCFDTNSLSLCI